MNKEKIKKVFTDYANKQDFILNPCEKHVDQIIDGILENEKNFGLKLCPCRLRDGSRQKDLELICPCNFKTQETWKNQGRCWCGLFVKKDGSQISKFMV